MSITDAAARLCDAQFDFIATYAAHLKSVSIGVADPRLLRIRDRVADLVCLLSGPADAPVPAPQGSPSSHAGGASAAALEPLVPDIAPSPTRAEPGAGLCPAREACRAEPGKAPGKAPSKAPAAPPAWDNPSATIALVSSPPAPAPAGREIAPAGRAAVAAPVGNPNQFDSDPLTVPAVPITAGTRSGRAVLAEVAALPPALYYLEDWGEFAVRAGPITLRGNVGEIYANGTRCPHRVKDCQHERCLFPGCAFYHDPEKHPQSKDVRNFIADAWVYRPPYARKAGGRPLGCVTGLAGDLEGMTREKARLFRAQVAHDLLCAIIIAQKFPEEF